MSSPVCAQVIIETLIAHGIRQAVLAPGSRSASLAMGLVVADQEARLSLQVRLDERDAGFLALGLAKATGEVVPVVTTSGTAVGNLLPAVMEASHSGVGLMVISADRPATMIGTGANQTTDQAGLFGAFPRATARLSSQEGGPDDWSFQTGRLITAARGTLTRDPGPVHLNVSFETPLVGDGRTEFTATAPTLPTPAPAPVTMIESGPRTVVVAGDADPRTGVRANAFARAGGLPLLAEPSSNARFGDALRCGRLLLEGPLAEEIERVVVFGHPTLSRPVARLLASQVEMIMVSESPRYPTFGRASWQISPSVSWVGDRDADWFARWRDADQQASAALDEITTGALNGWQVAAAVQGAVGPGHNLVIGSSNPIRDLDLAPVRAQVGPAYANRGLAGIDGTIATAAGIALATDRPTTALLGDVTCLHDVGGMLTGPLERRPNLRLVVLNDDGGAIFHTLEQGAPQYGDTFARAFATPNGVQFGPLAEAYGWVHAQPQTLDELVGMLGYEPQVLELIEVKVRRDNRRALTEAINQIGR